MTEMAVAVGRPWADYEDNINSEDTMSMYTYFFSTLFNVRNVDLNLFKG